MPTKNKVRLHKLKKSRYSNANLLVFAAVFALIGGYILWKSFAAPATPSIYLNPSAKTVNVGDTFTVDVYEDSGATDINVAQPYLSYPTSLLSYKGYTDGSKFPTAAEVPSGDTGSLHFTLATCGGCATLTGPNLVVTLTFKAVASGTATVDLVTGTNLFHAGNYVSGLNTAGGSYTVNGSTPTPSPTPNPTPTPPPSTTKPPSTPAKPTTTPHSVTPTPVPSTPSAPVVTPTQPSTAPAVSQPSTSTPTKKTGSGPTNSSNILLAFVAAAGAALVLGGAVWAWQNRPVKFDNDLSDHVVTSFTPVASAGPSASLANIVRPTTAGATAKPPTPINATKPATPTVKPEAKPVTTAAQSAKATAPKTNPDLQPAKITPRVIKPSALPKP